MARGWAGSGSTWRWRQARLVVLARDGWECKIKGPRCRGTADSVDHIVPLYQGGAKYDLNNCRAACMTCNTGRRDEGPAGTIVETRTAW